MPSDSKALAPAGVASYFADSQWRSLKTIVQRHRERPGHVIVAGPRCLQTGRRIGDEFAARVSADHAQSLQRPRDIGTAQAVVAMLPLCHDGYQDAAVFSRSRVDTRRRRAYFSATMANSVAVRAWPSMRQERMRACAGFLRRSPQATSESCCSTSILLDGKRSVPAAQPAFL